MQDRFEHFSCAIFEITRYWHKIASEEMGKYGLKAVHAVYILSLARNAEDGMTVGQLCEDCSRDKAETSRMLAILVKHGLVKKSSSSCPRRGIYHLTAAGLDIAEAVKGRVTLAVDMAGGELDDAERAVFYSSLDTVVCNLKKMSQKGLPE